MRQTFTAFGLVASLALASSAMAAPVASAEEDPVVLITRVQPPGEARQEPEQKPKKGHVWSPGFWMWNGVEHKWIPGEWLKERSGMKYQPPRWQNAGERWQFSVGHWTRN